MPNFIKTDAQCTGLVGGTLKRCWPEDFILTKMQELSCWGNPALGNEGLATLAKRMPNLKNRVTNTDKMKALIQEIKEQMEQRLWIDIFSKPNVHQHYYKSNNLNRESYSPPLLFSVFSNSQADRFDWRDVFEYAGLGSKKRS